MVTKLKEYKIIDAHTHIFPEKIATKAAASIGYFYGIPMLNDGTSERLLQSGALIGVENFLVCSTATKAEQVLPINDFIYSECQAHDKFIGFATLHPDMKNPEAEIERINERGFKGIKLHPDFQCFNIDDPKAMELYRLIEGKMFILFHTGDERYEYSRPFRLMNVCEKFPNLKCIAAHFGGYKRWDEAMKVYKSKNIFMDTSSTLFELPVERAREIIEQFGVSQFFFGTDFPMWSHKEELERFLALNLTESENEDILYNNFKKAIL